MIHKMRKFRVRLFKVEQKEGFLASVFKGKSKLKKGQILDLKIGRLTEYEYRCVDVFSMGKLVGEIRKSDIDELIEKGAFAGAEYAGFNDGVHKVTISCLETDEYRKKPEYKKWREKLNKRLEVEKQEREQAFPGELERMIEGLSGIATPVERHFQYQNIVNETYIRRKDPEMRKICKQIGVKHLNDFKNLTPSLEKEFNGLPRITTFQHLAMVLTEDGDYDNTIKVCKMALAYGLDDGTKTGYEGRIDRIEKKKAKQKK
jgi:hypothetical protein